MQRRASGNRKLGTGGASLSPRLCRLLLEPPCSRRGRPAAYSRHSSPNLQSTPAAPPRGPTPGAGRTGNVGTRTATGRSSSRTQDPGGSRSCTHKHTQARAPANPFARRSRKAPPQLFIHSPKGEVPFSRAPPSQDPRGLQGGQLRHEPPAIRPRPPSPLHPHTQPNRLGLHHDRQRRPRAGAVATPAPHSFVTPQPHRPAAPPRHSAQTCSARLAAPRPAGDAAAAATAAGKRRLLRSHAAS